MPLFLWVTYMADTTIDKLQIKVEAQASQAQSAIKGLAKSLTDVSNALNSFKGSTAGLSASLKPIQNLGKIDPKVLARSAVQLSNMSTALQRISSVNVKTSGVNTLVNSLARLGKVDTSGFDAAKLGKVADAIQALGNVPDVSASINRTVNALAKIASAGSNVGAAATALPQLSKNLNMTVQSLANTGNVSDGVVRLVTAISQLANAGAKTEITAQNLSGLTTATMEFFNQMAAAPDVSEGTIRLAEALAKLAASGYKSGSAAKSITDFGRAASSLKDKLKGVVSSLRTFFQTISQGIGKIRSFGTNLKNALSGAVGMRPGIDGLAGSIKTLIGAFLGIRGIYAVVDGIKKSLDLGSRVQEIENVVNTAFGGLKKGFTDLSDAVYDFASSTKASFGVGEVAARQYSGILMSMFNSSGFDQSDDMHKAAAQMSLDLTSLAGDIASFYDIDVSEAFQKIQSGMAGMIRPLRSIGKLQLAA